MSEIVLIEKTRLQTYLDMSSFQRWLGLTIDGVDDAGLAIRMPWREELISNPAVQSVHGGILASLIDLTGFYTILSRGKIVKSTIDMRADYHRIAKPGTLIAHGKVIKLGSSVSTCDTTVVAEDGSAVASGRGTYMMG